MLLRTCMRAKADVVKNHCYNNALFRIITAIDILMSIDNARDDTKASIDIKVRTN